jgi:peptidyl-prolyl cis-trans isomerase D
MLNIIREHADSWLIKSILWLIVFAFIGTIFYSWGMGGSSSSSPGGIVATVNGSKISQAEYERTFNNIINFYREQFQDQFSEELIQKLDLKTQALDTLIQKEILLIKANELNIQVSDTEVINQINTLAAFQKNKVFNNTVYQNYLKFKRLTPLEFEESQRELLLLEKIRNIIKSNAKVSPNELDEAFILANEKIKLDYIVIPNNHFKSEKKVNKEEIESFYEKNKNRFEIPERIKVQYVKAIPKTYENLIDIRDEDIEDYYKTKIADFRIKKMYKAAHILFRPEPKNDSSEEIIRSEGQAKEKANDVLKKINNGASFSDLAKKYSNDPVSGENGGSLGEFPEGMMVTEFENALRKLKPKETSEPIKTSYGFHIIRLNKITPERIKPLDEVKEEIIKKLKENKTRQKMRRVVKHIHRSAKEDQDLARAAQENNLSLETTSFISREDHLVPDIGNNPGFFNQAFSLEDNQVGDPVVTLESAFVMKVINREKPYIPELKDIEKLASKKTQEQKDQAFSTSKSESLANKLVDGTSDLESTAKTLELDLKHTPFFSRSDSIPGIGNLQKLKTKAFELDNGKSGWVLVRNNYYLIRLQERQKAGLPDEEALKELRQKLKLEKGDSVFQEWMENLKESYEILVDKSQV